MAPLTEIWSKLYRIFPDQEVTDFIVGEDDFKDVEINQTEISGFWYFKNSRKGLIKRFVLQRSAQVWKVCVVTLIKEASGKFSPRFDFQILNTSGKAIQQFSKESVDQNLIKAKVCFDSCHDNFSKLIDFLNSFDGQIDFGEKAYAVIPRDKKNIFDEITKDKAIEEFKKQYGESISEQDISLLQDRRSKLEYFKKLLDDQAFFKQRQSELGNKRPEDVWQIFFEENPWIFGYGLQLVACEGLDDRKLEQTVVGHDIIDGSGKRIDALLKTKGNISKILFCEIKTHFTGKLIEAYDRPGVFVPAEDLRGAVAQVQKTIHKATLKIHESYIRITKDDGSPTGEELLFVRPRGIVVIGRLDDFNEQAGINYEKLSSFEMYRQQISGIEVITFDELYERVKFIVES